MNIRNRTAWMPLFGVSVLLLGGVPPTWLINLELIGNNELAVHGLAGTAPVLRMEVDLAMRESKSTAAVGRGYTDRRHASMRIGLDPVLRESAL